MAEQRHMAADARHGDVGDNQPPHAEAQRLHDPMRHMVAEAGQHFRLDHQHQPAQREAAEAEGQAGEGDHLGDGQRRQAPGGIEAIPHRRTRHRRKAQIMGQRIGTEGCEGGARIAHRMPGIDAAEPVVDGQHRESEHGPARRDPQCRGRDRMQRGADLRDRQVAEFLLRDIDRDRQQDQPKDRHAMPLQHGQPALHAARTVMCRRDRGRARSRSARSCRRCRRVRRSLRSAALPAGPAAPGTAR